MRPGSKKPSKHKKEAAARARASRAAKDDIGIGTQGAQEKVKAFSSKKYKSHRHVPGGPETIFELWFLFVLFSLY